jgi:predicted ribosomally synthesized peptide with nif11-like leader
MLTTLVGGAKLEAYTPHRAMSAEKLTAFWAAVEPDAGLKDKLKAAVEGEIDTADETAAVIAIAKEAGFTITAADLLRNQAQDILELSDEELEGVAGGIRFGDLSGGWRGDPGLEGWGGKSGIGRGRVSWKTLERALAV